MKNLSNAQRNAEYYCVMKKRIQFYAEKYDPYNQYISTINQLSQEVPVQARRERRFALIQSFFLNIF